VELQLKLTEKDYRNVARGRADRLWYKYRPKKLALIDWVGMFGLMLAVIPVILSSVNDIYLGHGEATALLVVFTLLLIFSFIRVGVLPRQRIKKDILAKWGIKDKKGKRWASE
jgi:hypothetical protein